MEEVKLTVSKREGGGQDFELLVGSRLVGRINGDIHKMESLGADKYYVQVMMTKDGSKYYRHVATFTVDEVVLDY